jgi:SAM-dependent methyltransferase
MSMNKGPQCLDQSRVQPALMLRQLAFVMRVSRALYAAAQLGIADLLAGGPMTSNRLALAAGADAQSLRRLLRALVAYGVFEEDAPDRYCLNAAAELLRRDVPGSQRAAVLFTAGNVTWQLWADFLESVRTGHAVVERTFGKTIFERHAENREESALFGQAMAAFSAALSQPLIAAYDFSSFKCIADIGGGTGRLLADILAANPKVRGILFDLPDVSTAAPPLLKASGVAGRCKLVAGNFFEGVPAGADAYLLKHVLHDWDDARATEIISNCRKAMARSATLLIVERVLPERAEQARSAEAYLVDLEMLVNTPGGRERTEGEFRTILSAAGFATTRVMPTTTPVNVIEARPA